MRDLSVEGQIGSGQQQAISYTACASGVVAKARESAVVGAESSQDLWMLVCLKCYSLDASLLQPAHDRARTCDVMVTA